MQQLTNTKSNTLTKTFDLLFSIKCQFVGLFECVAFIVFNYNLLSASYSLKSLTINVFYILFLNQLV